MTFHSARVIAGLVCSLVLLTGCGSGTSATRQVPVGPTAPTGPGGSSGPVTLSAPAPVSPVDSAQLSTLRPTLIVQNTTSSQQSGTRTYEFQVSDRTDFALGASLTASLSCGREPNRRP